MGKSAGTAPPVPTLPPEDTTSFPMMMSMLGMMEQMSSQQQQYQPPAPIAPPTVAKTTPIDWEEVSNQQIKKSKADNAIANAKRKGRRSTIHSSLAEDDTEDSGTTSLLGGK